MAVVKSLRWLLTEGWDHQDAAYSATFTFRLLFHSPIVQAPRLHSSVPGHERRVMLHGKLGELNYDMSDKDTRPVQRNPRVPIVFCQVEGGRLRGEDPGIDSCLLPLFSRPPRSRSCRVVIAWAVLEAATRDTPATKLRRLKRGGLSILLVCCSCADSAPAKRSKASTTRSVLRSSIHAFSVAF